MDTLLLVLAIMSSVLALNLGCDVIICEGDKETIDCPKGLMVDIQEAFFGRIDGTTCSDNIPIWHLMNTDCSSPEALDKYREICDKNTSCTVEASNSVIGEPCQGTYKYALIRYICVAANTALMCCGEWEWMKTKRCSQQSKALCKKDVLNRTQSTNSSLVPVHACPMTSTPATAAVTSDVRTTIQNTRPAVLTTDVSEMSTEVAPTPNAESLVDGSCEECCFKLDKSRQLSHEEMKSILRNLKYHCSQNKIDC